jgi:hypothetical protein
MLSVSAMNLAYQTIDLSTLTNWNVTAQAHVAIASFNVTGSVSRITGSATYSAANKGVITIADVQGTTDVSSFGSEAFEGSTTGVTPITDSNGKLSGQFAMTEPITKTFNVTGTLNPSTMTVTIKFPNYTVLSGGHNVTIANLQLSAKVPTNPAALSDVITSANLVPGTAESVDVTVSLSSVEKAASETAAAATITLYWANATGGTMSAVAGDTISLAWNEASGSYTISKLPKAPKGATGLKLVVKVGTMTTQTVVPLQAT